MEKKEIRIFYSWQSDLNENTNRYFIRDILKKAIKKLEEELSCDFVLDEATAEEIGSPNIPQTIVEKISKADIFIVDVSIVNNINAHQEERKMPNPNVMYELGFAVAGLGWERVLLAFNKAFGTVKNLPFDIDRHRVSLSYSFNKPGDKAEIKRVTEANVNKFSGSIKKILERNPMKGTFIKKPVEEIQRERDIKNIKRFLSGIQIETFDLFMEELPRIVINDIFHYSEILANISKSSRFHLYNTELYDLIVEFCSSFFAALSYEQHYQPNRDSSLLIWQNPFDMPLTGQKQTDWNAIEKHVGIMRKTLRSILTILRNEYLEIDVDAISRHNFEQAKK